MNFLKVIKKANKDFEDKNFKQAVVGYEKALELEPNHKQIFYNLGVVYLHLEEFYNAIECLQKAIALDPQYTSAYTNLGIGYKKIKEYTKAINALLKALEKRGDDPDILYNMANTFASLEEYDKSLEYFDKVLRIDKNYYKAHHGKGLVYNHLLDFDKSEISFQESLKIKNNYPDAVFALSLIKLRRGDFLNGWRDYEARFEANNPLKKPIYAVPFFDGENLKEKTILIQEEQGFGDNIQFIRYINLIKQQNPKKIYVAVRKELMRVFATIDDICVVTDNDTLYDVDFIASLLSMPRIFKTTLNTIPKAITFNLKNEDKKLTSHIKTTKNLKVGFAYQGNKEHKNDNYRSIPLEIFKSLFEYENIDFYSLQIGENKELKKIKNDFANLADCSEIIGDFYDTAQIISKLDLVITIDSALAHFSGTMGVKTFLLLPQNGEWRWLTNRDDSPWYPSIKIFRQEKLGFWRETLSEVKMELKSLEQQICGASN